MDTLTPMEIFGLGCLGGAVPDVLRLIKGRRDGAPAYLKTAFFWVMFLVLILLGGGIAVWLNGPGVKEALTFGFTAPEVISRFFGSDDADRGATGGGFVHSVRRWWGY
jgi:hypothetical protein